jgi:hypothetical protein
VSVGGIDCAALGVPQSATIYGQVASRSPVERPEFSEVESVRRRKCDKAELERRSIPSDQRLVNKAMRAEAGITVEVEEYAGMRQIFMGMALAAVTSLSVTEAMAFQRRSKPPVQATIKPTAHNIFHDRPLRRCLRATARAIEVVRAHSSMRARCRPSTSRNKDLKT